MAIPQFIIRLVFVADMTRALIGQFRGIIYLAHINRAGGQDSPIQIDLARLIRCLLYGKEENFNSFNVTGLVTSRLQTAKSIT